MEHRREGGEALGSAALPPVNCGDLPISVPVYHQLLFQQGELVVCQSTLLYQSHSVVALSIVHRPPSRESNEDPKWGPWPGLLIRVLGLGSVVRSPCCSGRRE